MKVSWIILTYNRSKTVERCFNHNYSNSGYPFHQIVWVDNGSRAEDWMDMYRVFEGKIAVNHKSEKNEGVAVGYNKGLLLSNGDYLVITGCDRLMPKDWLLTYIQYYNKILNTGVISTYSKIIKEVPERIHRSNHEEVGIIEATPMEAKFFSKKFLDQVGYFREDFGLYGWEDVEWGLRSDRVAKEKGLINYIIQDQIATHLGSEGVLKWNGKDEKEYYEFKKKEAQDPKKQELMQRCRKENYPYYNPYL